MTSFNKNFVFRCHKQYVLYDSFMNNLGKFRLKWKWKCICAFEVDFSHCPRLSVINRKLHLLCLLCCSQLCCSASWVTVVIYWDVQYSTEIYCTDLYSTLLYYTLLLSTVQHYTLMNNVSMCLSAFYCNEPVLIYTKEAVFNEWFQYTAKRNIAMV